MERTTVMLPADLKARATRRARERGISLGELLRESLAALLTRSPESERKSDPLFADAEIYDGPAPSDLSASHDDYLYGEQTPR